MSSIEDPSSKAKNPVSIILPPEEVALVRGRCASPRFALRSDGVWLLAVEGLPPTADLKHRETWTAIVVTPAERDLLLERLGNAEAEAAAHLYGRLAKPKPDTDPTE